MYYIAIQIHNFLLYLTSIQMHNFLLYFTVVQVRYIMMYFTTIQIPSSLLYFFPKLKHNFFAVLHHLTSTRYYAVLYYHTNYGLNQYKMYWEYTE